MSADINADRWAQPDAANLEFVEDLYTRYLADPSSVSPEWREYFQALSSDDSFAANPRLGPSFPRTSVFNPPGSTNGRNGTIVRRNGAAGELDAAEDVLLNADLSVEEFAALQDRVDQLIRAYRVRGHLIASLDPLGIEKNQHPELDPSYYGLNDADMKRKFSTRTIKGTPKVMTLDDILEHLSETYCRSIGAQFMHIDDIQIKTWLQNRMESTQNRITLSQEEQIRILTELTDATILEDFLQKKYLGLKRFSLEGAESLIPLLDLAIDHAGAKGMEEIVIGMAHRGRLNVLANIIGKSPRQIFWEFEDKNPEFYRGGGDVKYHLGYSGDRGTSSGNPVHVSLCFNPSHLEFVNPVALGRMRAKHDRFGERARDRGMVVLIHGDAAFAGQGVTQETLNLSELDGYSTGGALHVIVNNQVGFTTGPIDARSTLYASGVARMLQIPIFHVNGEDPEAVAQVVRMAMDFRAEFRRDVVIDMYCYRKYGHNEGDEPAFTQPKMYDVIRKRRTVRESYMKRLIELGEVTAEDAAHIEQIRRAVLENELSVARSGEYTGTTDAMLGEWEGYDGGADEQCADDVETGLDRETIRHHADRLTAVPEAFTPHKKIERILIQRREMGSGERAFDWAMAELLAMASIAADGHRVRFSGQDSQRGTFSHRHAVLHDVKTGEEYCPLEHIAPSQAPVQIFNSPLSEVAVLGFEYGYSLDFPDALVMWEAQFGDFCNVAQPIIDQFIVSAEDKWRRLSGLVLLLPHGFEGQGPEHSSARLERFLTLAAEDNIQVVNATTPAQYFHLLRRQVLRSWRKPLVVMTPKSLLRHPKAVSDISEFEGGRFRRILRDPNVTAGTVDAAGVTRIILCSGKIYYELEAEREKRGRTDVAILRLEQLYPLHDRTLAEALGGFTDGTPVVWVQEEPENAGAWRYLRVRFVESVLGRHPFSGIFREASASPATGSGASHRIEQDEILARAFEGDA